jgi:hypothetical protein
MFQDKDEGIFSDEANRPPPSEKKTPSRCSSGKQATQEASLEYAQDIEKAGQA